MGDGFLRKQVVFNKKSPEHMSILNEVLSRSNNFSGYVLCVLRGHFMGDIPEIEDAIMNDPKVQKELEKFQKGEELNTLAAPPPPKLKDE